MDSDLLLLCLPAVCRESSARFDPKYPVMRDNVVVCGESQVTAVYDARVEDKTVSKHYSTENIHIHRKRLIFLLYFSIEKVSAKR